jgi:hypothetical protein
MNYFTQSLEGIKRVIQTEVDVSLEKEVFVAPLAIDVFQEPAQHGRLLAHVPQQDALKALRFLRRDSV